MHNPLLKIKNVSKSYNETTDYSVDVLKDFSLDVAEGDFITIVGSNGTGKSTLFKIISCQINPTLGEVELDGGSLNGKKEHVISQYISQVKQQPNDNLILTLTLFENLCLAKLRSSKAGFKLDKKSLRDEFHQTLSALGVGLEKRLDDLVTLFSGGQKQIIALVMATINNPKILLLDEHTASLDPVNSEKVVALTKKIVEEKKITTLMITHNISHAIEAGNRLILLSKGKVRLDLSGEEKRGLTIEKLIKDLHHEHLELEADIG